MPHIFLKDREKLEKLLNPTAEAISVMDKDADSKKLLA